MKKTHLRGATYVKKGMLSYSQDTFEIGVDECGRGCLAGPVVAAAVLWDPAWLRSNLPDPIVMSIIKDSKKLSAKRRMECDAYIRKHAHTWSLSFVDEATIDSKNILEATYDAMHACLDDMFVKNPAFRGRLLIDGNRFRPYDEGSNVDITDVRCVVGGDNVHLCIASASILAKVARDEYMERMSERYDDRYGWKTNKGYGTREHIEGIERHGVCELHRKSFRRCC